METKKRKDILLAELKQAQEKANDRVALTKMKQWKAYVEWLDAQADSTQQGMNDATCWEQFVENRAIKNFINGFLLYTREHAELELEGISDDIAEVHVPTEVTNPLED